jgi:hypothetical protein
MVPMRNRSLIGFPNPVNEKAARVVAGGVLGLTVVSLALSVVDDRWLWMVAPLAYGFVARVLTGPTLSPLGRFATTVAAPRLGAPKLVPGPPKRFAQAIGAAFTLAALGLLIAGVPGGTQALLGVMVLAAGLESIFAYCIGCKMFGLLMRAGVIPQEICAECADVSLRLAA